MKKIFIIVLIVLIMTTSVFAAMPIGTKMGNILSTDIMTYINGEKISSFNIDGKTAIFVSELKNFGIPVLWNSNKRTVEIIIEKNIAEKLPIETSGEKINQTEIIYSDSINIPMSTSILDTKQVMLLNDKDQLVNGVDVSIKDGIVNLSKTYYLKLGGNYKLKFIKGNDIYIQNIKIKENLEKESFTTTTRDYFKSVIVPANPSKGFYFPYRLMFWKDRYGPNGKTLTFDDTKPMLYIESTNHGTDKSFETMMMKANDTVGAAFSYDIMRDTKYNGFAMIGIFPRLRERDGIYTHALDRQTLFGTEDWFAQFNRGNLYRIDQQFVEMHKDAKEQLARLGKKIDKPYLTGFSASSDFASRMNYLHPDLAKAVIINDAPTMPLTEYNEVELKFPLGIADIQEVTGEAFDKSKFIDTPQFWTTGTYDTNDGVYFPDGWGAYTLNEPEYNSGIDRNQEGIDYRKAFGDDIIQRKTSIRNILVKNGFNNIEFHSYDVGHGLTEQTLKDVEVFIDKIE